MKFIGAAIGALVLLLLAAGCASHPGRIDCEAHLRPINPPTGPGGSAPVSDRP